MYIGNLVTPIEDESTLNSIKKCWSYIKSTKTDYNSITSPKQKGKLITGTKQTEASVLNQQFQSVFSESSTVTTQKFTEHLTWKQQ